MVVIDWLQTGIDIVVDGVILVSLLGILSVFSSLNSQMALSQQSSLKMETYTEYNQYDGTHVYAQDVTAAVMSYRGFPAVNVRCTKSTSATTGDTWSESVQATAYTATKINEKLDQDVIYDANIERNANGQVIAVTFWACNDTDCQYR